VPIIAAETNVFPDDLLDRPLDDSPDRCWWAVYTKARQEKALARDLLKHEVPFYLPLVPKDNLIRGRRVRSIIPLFSGYVFVFGCQQERTRVLMTNRVSRILPVPDQEGLLSDLGQVWTLIEADAPLTIERRLKPGQRVRVKSGAMKGVEGKVVSRRASCRLLVAVHFLQQGVSVEIDDYMLEPLR